MSTLFETQAPRPLADRLRPADLDQVVGQDHLLAADGPIGRMLGIGRLASLVLWGPPGTGKTTIARLMAERTELHFSPLSAVFSGVADLRKVFDEARRRREMGQGTLLFIDEIHRLPRTVEEVLYPAMEDFELDIVLGKGPAARSIRLELPNFTLIGATTRTGLIAKPLRDRFGLVSRLEFYEVEDLDAIVTRAATILDVDIDRTGSYEIARRARGTPRIANRLLRRVRDYAEVKFDGKITADIAHDGLAIFGVDDRGFDKIDRGILQALCGRFGGGPVGLSTLAISVTEPTETLEDVYEPFLIQQGMLMRTPRGRVATPAAWEHMQITPPSPVTPASQTDLFTQD